MSTEIAVKKDRSIKALLTGDEFKQQIDRALPRHLSADRFIRIALTATTRTPKLLECTPESFFKCLLDLSASGLEPDGRRAHLIPYANRKLNIVECQLIVDYKGLVELVMRSGEVSNIHADVVCDNDEFEYNLGEIKAHKIDFKKKRGDVYAAYAVATFKDGTKKAEVLGYDEIEAVRGRSKAGDSGPWVSDWAEMAKKTAFRRLSKWLPLSPELRDKVEIDDEPRMVNVTPQEDFRAALHAKPDAAPELSTTPPDPVPEPPNDGAPTTPLDRLLVKAADFGQDTMEGQKTVLSAAEKRYGKAYAVKKFADLADGDKEFLLQHFDELQEAK